MFSHILVVLIMVNMNFVEGDNDAGTVSRESVSELLRLRRSIVSRALWKMLV